MGWYLVFSVEDTDGFCIIEGRETVLDFSQMQLQEIRDNITSRRNKIFLLMEEVRVQTWLLHLLCPGVVSCTALHLCQGIIPLMREGYNGYVRLTRVAVLNVRVHFVTRPSLKG